MVKDVVIVGFSIDRSVGLGGFNDPDDISTIKHLLNGIPADKAGAFGSLDEADTRKTGDDFDRMVDAIKIFQDVHLKRFFTPDGLVDPERRTIRTLREEFFKAAPQPPKDKKSVTVKPVEPLGGFSRERLSKGGGTGDWVTIEFDQPSCQMVPLGKSRSLLFLTNNDNPQVGVQNSDPDVARIDVTDTSVKITGLKRGESIVTIVANGTIVETIRVTVRREIGKAVHFHFLGDPARGAGASPGGSATMIEHLNRIYRPQANIVFSLGTERAISVVNGRTVDFTRAITVDPTGLGTPDPSKQWFKGSEFATSCINIGSDLNVFVCPRLDVPTQPTATGVAKLAGLQCWFDQKVLKELGQGTSLTGHEIGHSIGLHHIQVAIKAMMRPEIGPNDVFIPSETLDELIIS